MGGTETRHCVDVSPFKRVVGFPENNLQPPPTTMILGAGIVAFVCTGIRQSLMEEVKDSGSEEDEKN